MRKIGLMLGAFAISVCCHATSTTSLNTDLKSAILNTAKQTNSASNPSMIYGGQDISRRIIATANQSVWSGQPDLIG